MMIIYEKIFKKFAEAKIDYIIVGGIAANLLGMVRSTADLDILIDINTESLLKADSILRGLKYKMKQPIDIKKLNKGSLAGLAKVKNLKAINYYKPSEISEIDIIIDSPVSFVQAKKKAGKVSVAGMPLPVISIDDLIKMKSVTGRAVDKYDIAELKKIKRIKST